MEGAGANQQTRIAGNLLDANSRHGIWIDGGRNNTIGGANSEPLGYPQVQPAPDPRPEPITSKTLGNVLTRNGGNGIRIEGGQSDANRGNAVGNLIAGNGLGGIVVTDAATVGTQITGNFHNPLPITRRPTPVIGQRWRRRRAAV
jgi:hypothetical protein